MFIIKCAADRIGELTPDYEALKSAKTIDERQILPPLEMPECDTALD
jgi:hypothetical protein